MERDSKKNLCVCTLFNYAYLLEIEKMSVTRSLLVWVCVCLEQSMPACVDVGLCTVCPCINCTLVQFDSLTSPSLQSRFEDREPSWPWHITIMLTLHQTDLPNLPMLPINFTWAMWGQTMFKVRVVLAQEIFCWASRDKQQGLNSSYSAHLYKCIIINMALSVKHYGI